MKTLWTCRVIYLKMSICFILFHYDNFILITQYNCLIVKICNIFNNDIYLICIENYLCFFLFKKSFCLKVFFCLKLCLNLQWLLVMEKILFINSFMSSSAFISKNKRKQNVKLLVLSVCYRIPVKVCPG